MNIQKIFFTIRLFFLSSILCFFLCFGFGNVFADDLQVSPKIDTTKSTTLYEVDYRNTGRTADLTQWGDFSETSSVGSLAQKILNFFLMITGGLALLAFMIGGGMIMLGGADETLLERGKDILKYASIGVAVVVLSYVITTLVQTILYSVGE